MPCYRPIKGFKATPSPLYPKGKFFFVEYKIQGSYLPSTIPCGTCVGCRLEKSRQWAIRCVHEAQLHEKNCFITLTFNDEAMSQRQSKYLLKRDFQLFMKKLRKRFGKGIRYYHAGEYGPQFQRPHYHACIFGFDFPDKTIWKASGGHNLYRSKALEELWPYGYSSIGEFDFNTAAYVARYTMKKIYGNGAKDHYEYVDRSTGEVTSVQPEYSTMSRRPGIGAGWFEKYSADVFPKDHVILRGREMKPPRYYDRLFEAQFPSDFQSIKASRNNKARKNLLDNTPERLHVREQVTLLNQKQLKRSYEE